MQTLRKLKLLICLSTLIALLINSGANLSAFSITSRSTSASSKCSTWKIVSSPTIKFIDVLQGVAAISPTNIWTAGYYIDRFNPPMTLIEHWDGTRWSIVPSDNGVLNGDNELSAVAAVSANDIWSVGYYDLNHTTIHRTLIEHWDGSHWIVVTSSNLGSSNNDLLGVAAVSAHDVWAVGDYIDSSSNYQTLIEHWDGSQWSIIHSPRSGYYGQLLGVSAVSTKDIWTVGVGSSGTLTEHWNGNQWSIVHSPNGASSWNTFFAVTAVSSADVWTVGFDYSSKHQRFQTLIEHWNGHQWNIVPGPNVGSKSNALYGVAAISPNDIWAVGSDYSNTPSQTLTEHWNGTKWSLVPSPNVGASDNFLTAVAVTASNVWTVGYYARGNSNHTLTEFYC